MTTLQPALFTTAPQPADAAPIPAWLLRRLDADGVIDMTTGATRRARLVRCQKCHVWVVRGLNDDRCALAVDCDPEPLSPLGEALARVAGAAVFELGISGGRPQLERRDRWAIARHPAGSRATDVLAGHECGRVLPLARGPSRLPVPSDPGDLPETPPF